jgi:hypothetical protein
MKKLYIHDDGSIICVDHAPSSLAGSLEDSPRKRLHWTPRGTWELAPKGYSDYFKKETGVDFDCESCSAEKEKVA